MSSFSAYPLYDGTFSVGLDKKFNPIGRDDSPAKGALKISLNPFLIKSEKHNILVDTGIGTFGENTSPATLVENLDDHDIARGEVTDIFASHLHYDHIGGLVGKKNGDWQLTFPDAKVWVSKSGWEKAMNLDPYYDEEKDDFLHFVDAHANLHFLGDGDEPYPGIQAEIIGGHTEFSQLLTFKGDQQKYLMAGDVLATKGEVNRKFQAKYDRDPERSLEMRQEITQKAYEEGYIIMAYHDSHEPLLQLTDYSERSGYTITNIKTDEPA